MKPLKFLAAAVLPLLLFAGCKGGGSSTPATVTDFCSQYADAVCQINCGPPMATCTDLPGGRLPDHGHPGDGRRKAVLHLEQHGRLHQQDQIRLQQHQPDHALDAGEHRPRLQLRLSGQVRGHPDHRHLHDPVRLCGDDQRIDHLRPHAGPVRPTSSRRTGASSAATWAPSARRISTARPAGASRSARRRGPAAPLRRAARPSPATAIRAVRTASACRW